MIYYESSIFNKLLKNKLPKNVIKHFNNAFIALDRTKDLKLFEIKQLSGDFKRSYFRLSKGKYRVIFFIENNDFYIIEIGKREEVYDIWELHR